MKKITIITLLFISLFFNVQTQSAEITVGGQNISIPSPFGFIEVSSISPETLEFFEDFCSPTNRLLAAFVSEDDAELIIQGIAGELNSYMMVQCSKEFEAISVTKYQFKEFRKIFRSQFNSIFEKQIESIDELEEQASHAISKKTNEKFDFSVGDIVPLGIDSETDSSITSSLLAKYSVILSGKPNEYIVAGTMCTLLVNEKVIYLYVYKVYNETGDLEWTRQTAKSWVETVLSANHTTQSLGVFEIICDAILAGLGGALVVIFFTVVICICYVLYYLLKAIIGKSKVNSDGSNEYTLGINPSYNIDLEKREDKNILEITPENVKK